MNIQESKTLDSLLKVIYKNLSQKQINKLSGKIKSIFKKKYIMKEIKIYGIKMIFF